MTTGRDIDSGKRDIFDVRRDSVTPRARAIRKTVTCHGVFTVTHRDTDRDITSGLGALVTSRSRGKSSAEMLEALERHVSHDGFLTRWECAFVMGCRRHIKLHAELTDKQAGAVRAVFVVVANRMAAA